MPEHIYLDNAATSFPKPEAVWQAMDNYNRQIGAAAGRGAYAASIAASGIVERCRKQVAQLLRTVSSRIVFTFNGTDSLNLAIHGTLRSGDHVITTEIEHNSVLRPLRRLEQERGIQVTRVPVDPTAKIDPQAVRAALRPNTRLISCMHASNVSGAIQPVGELAAISRTAGALLLVDAAQTAGHVPIDVGALGADLLACPGHKGLLGPLGTGVLYLREGVEDQVASFRQGGTGTKSEDDHQPQSLPDKFESGNHNVPGLAGLEAATAWLQEQGIGNLARREEALIGELLEGLGKITGVRVLGPATPAGRVGVVSFTIEGYEPHHAAVILDQSFGIQVRSGLHCAPGAHRALGTLKTGGTLRISVGPFTTSHDISAACAAIGEIASSR